MIGSVVPLTLAGLFVFGCCVLPFHRTLHKVAPLCHITASLTPAAQHQDSTPAREKTEQTVNKSVPTDLTARAEVVVDHTPSALQAVRAHPGYRSFVSLGALRCDEDVGAHLSLLDTFRI